MWGLNHNITVGLLMRFNGANNGRILQETYRTATIIGYMTATTTNATIFAGIVSNTTVGLSIWFGLEEEQRNIYLIK